LRAQRGNLSPYYQPHIDCRVATAPRNDVLIRISLDVKQDRVPYAMVTDNLKFYAAGKDDAMPSVTQTLEK
jgi:hypothetical protein